MRRRIALVAALATVLAACGDTSSIRVGPLPLCDSPDPAMLVLMAQAVPSAGQIPCVEDLPQGWGLRQADIESSEVELTFAHQGFGSVALTFAASCESARGTERPEEREDTDIATVEFPGGCVTIESPQRLAAAEMTSAFGFVTRDELRETSGLELGDRR